MSPIRGVTSTEDVRRPESAPGLVPAAPIPASSSDKRPPCRRRRPCCSAGRTSEPSPEESAVSCLPRRSAMIAVLPAPVSAPPPNKSHRRPPAARFAERPRINSPVGRPRALRAARRRTPGSRGSGAAPGGSRGSRRLPQLRRLRGTAGRPGDSADWSGPAGRPRVTPCTVHGVAALCSRCRVQPAAPSDESRGRPALSPSDERPAGPTAGQCLVPYRRSEPVGCWPQDHGHRGGGGGGCSYKHLPTPTRSDVTDARERADPPA